MFRRFKMEKWPLVSGLCEEREERNGEGQEAKMSNILSIVDVLDVHRKLSYTDQFRQVNTEKSYKTVQTGNVGTPSTDST